MLQTLGNDLIVGTTMNSLHLASLMDGPDDLPLSGAVIDSRPITQVYLSTRNLHCPFNL